MKRSFSHVLLITYLILLGACKHQYINTSATTRNLLVTDSTMPADSQFVQHYLPYSQKLEENTTRVISISQEEMVKGKPESKLTNFLADMLLTEGKRASREKSYNITPQISYFNYGGIRTFIPKGEVTVGKIFELMPFENEMVFLRLTGAQVQEFLNNIAARGGDSVGGVRFRISEGKAEDIRVDSKALDLETDYWMVTNDYVASGGDGMEVLTKRKEILIPDFKIRDAIINHLEEMHRNKEVIHVVPDGRIVNETQGVR